MTAPQFVTGGPRLRGRLRRLVLTVGLLLGLAVVAAPSAAAHPVIVGSNPEMGATVKAPPEVIELDFDHVIDTKFPAVAITIGEDIPVDLTVRVDDRKVYATVGEVPDLVVDGPIVWKVGYRMLAVDGTPLGGTLMFFVDDGFAGAPPVTADVAVSESAAAPDSPAVSATPSAADPAPATTDLAVVPVAAEEESGPGSVIWILVAVAVLAAIAGALWARSRRSAPAAPTSGRTGTPTSGGRSGGPARGSGGGRPAGGARKPGTGRSR